MSFGKDIQKFAMKAAEKMEGTISGSILELFGDIVVSTPVGNPKIWKVNEGRTKLIKPSGYTGGTLRGNWNLQLNMVDNTVNVNSKSGGKANRKARSRMKKFNGQTVYISNHLPYARRVEYGWSKQAPQGMVRINVRRWNRIVSRNAKK